MHTLQKRTTKLEQKMASQSLNRIKGFGIRLHTERSKGVKIRLEESGEQVTIPDKAFFILLDVLSNMSEGKSITIMPSETELSSRQAAEMLNMSRPHLVKLLESGKMPFKKVGSHRRVLLNDVIEYKEKLRQNREDQLTFLAKQAQQLNLGYA
jgi:excisionase family DNA binding protein